LANFLLQSKRHFSASGFSNFWQYCNPNAIFQLLVLAIFGDSSSSNAIFQLLVLAIFGDIASWIGGGC
jgi:hypothetical protein